jgi:hypothetical protein
MNAKEDLKIKNYLAQHTGWPNTIKFDLFQPIRRHIRQEALNILSWLIYKRKRQAPHGRADVPYLGLSVNKKVDKIYPYYANHFFYYVI